MKNNRASLLVSRSLEKSLLRQGLARDPAEPGELARRYPLLRDAQTFVGESQKRPSPIANLLESVKQFSTETQTQSETGVHYRCL
jgi:hypothetical protein